MLKEIIKYRDLLFMLTLREIRIRYKQASLGFMWALFMPAMAVLAGIMVRKAMSIVSGVPMNIEAIAAISVKVLPWTFFINAVKFCTTSLIGDRNLVTKIYFPREVIPFAYILASLFDFCIASVVLAVALTIMRIGVSLYLLWLPVIFIILILLTTGLGLIFSTANLFMRDIKYIVEICIMFGIFFTPVFYEARMFGRWEKILLANPIGGILELINGIIVHKTLISPGLLLYTAICSIAIFTLGLTIFHKNEPFFAEAI